MMTEPTSPHLLRVFLCHSSADKPAVRELYQRLRADGFEPRLDEEDLLPGQDWQREIPRAVRQSDVVIVCLSRVSINKAGYVQKEIKFALDVADEQPEGAIFLIPLKLEECEVPERLSRWQWVNLFSLNGDERLIRALQVRAVSFGSSASPTLPSAAPPPQSKASTAPVQSASNVSGGVSLEGQQVSIGNDVVGRDKITYNVTQVIQMPSFTPPPDLEQLPRKVTPFTNVQTWGGVEFVRIPAGKFLMGSKDDNKLAEDDEKPQHTIEIPYDYWMARYPVTNAQIAKFAEAVAYQFILDKNWKKTADEPVVNVSWREAVEYCEWLNSVVAADIQAVKAQVRLPSEAEWEKAAHGDAQRGHEWPWGNEFDPNKCNSIEGKKGGPTPVSAPIRRREIVLRDCFLKE